jgi:hypothetical protein
MPTYYVKDLAKASVTELWRVAKREPKAVLGLLLILRAKILGKPARMGHPFNPLDTKIIEYSDVPEDVWRCQQPLVSPILAAGFTPIFAIQQSQPDGANGYSLVFQSANGLISASALYGYVKTGDMELQESCLVLSSRRTNGTVLATSNARPILLDPPEIEIIYLQKAAPEKLLARHQKRLTKLTDLVLLTPDDTRRRIQSIVQRNADFHISRGLYSPATADELRRFGLLSS